MEYIIVVLLISTGAISLLKPNLVWRLSERWKTKEAEEPSETFLIRERLVGIWSILLGIGAFVGILLGKYYF
ncbi:DUF6199 family natural product biosynthesis protein [Ornithinibacillus contaminans]|uniref:DUF6199 family natural product biosynthesis protein n=1 Tax=Ornithinibacillus contaminans TaxID=694055 RepID=UPI00064D90E9|nr:DUF6199 family natural product biosynthesis protein [Ornithinibacillus contaminans]